MFGLAVGFGKFFAVHERRALCGQRLFFAFLRGKAFKLGHDVAQVIFLRAGLRDAVFGLRQRFLRRAPFFVRRARGGKLPCVAGKIVQHRAVGFGVEQPLRFELAVNLDQRRAQRAQQRDAGGLVVDESLAAAVGGQGAAQDKFCFRLQPVVAQEVLRGMRRRHVEHGGNAGLFLPVAHKPCVGARAQRQPQRVEQNGFARAGFARQGQQPRVARQIDH